MNGNMRTRKYDSGTIALKEKQSNLTTQELIEALYDAERLMESSMCPFFLLDETARQCRAECMKLDPHLELDEITLGVNERHMAESVRAMIRTIQPKAEWLDANISYMFKRVPVVIWRIKKDFEVFKNPDKITFYTEDFLIPNPFDKYWNKRHIVLD